jgi:hypothetical protein
MIDKFINTRMLANPFNWAIIYLVLVFGGMAVRTIATASKGYDLPGHNS